MAPAKRSMLLAAGFLFLCATGGGAQSLYRDQWVRITAPQLDLRRQQGHLQWLDADSLVLTASSHRWVVPRHLLTQVDSSRGRRGHALIGVVAGGVVGLAVGAILFSPNSSACEGSGNYAQNCRLYRAGIVAAGAGLGLLVGAQIRTERWVPLRLRSLQFTGPQ
ncbi:MAG TPA: hypothetical protein VLB49_00235 [Gemmatimonadales bacterium]|nr:hypothetical protein [Gemmatimonadales bacterium]